MKSTNKAARRYVRKVAPGECRAYGTAAVARRVMYRSLWNPYEPPYHPLVWVNEALREHMTACIDDIFAGWDGSSLRTWMMNDDVGRADTPCMTGECPSFEEITPDCGGEDGIIRGWGL